MIDIFLRYMGGQSHAMCAKHNLSLIVSSNIKKRFDKSFMSELFENRADDESSSYDVCSCSDSESYTDSDIDNDSLTDVHHTVLPAKNNSDNDYDTNNSNKEDDMSDDSITR